MKKHNWGCGKQQVMFRCKKDGKTFALKAELQAHERKEHPSQNSFKCPNSDCGETFSMKSEVWSHVKQVHSVVRYACDTCKEEFKFQTDLHQHEVANHGRPRSYPCKDCKECFASEDLFKFHKRNKHWSKSAQNQNIVKLDTNSPAKAKKRTALDAQITE